MRSYCPHQSFACLHPDFGAIPGKYFPLHLAIRFTCPRAPQRLSELAATGKRHRDGQRSSTLHFFRLAQVAQPPQYLVARIRLAHRDTTGARGHVLLARSFHRSETVRNRPHRKSLTSAPLRSRPTFACFPHSPSGQPQTRAF